MGKNELGQKTCGKTKIPTDSFKVMEMGVTSQFFSIAVIPFGGLDDPHENISAT